MQMRKMLPDKGVEVDFDKELRILLRIYSGWYDRLTRATIIDLSNPRKSGRVLPILQRKTRW